MRYKLRVRAQWMRGHRASWLEVHVQDARLAPIWHTVMWPEDWDSNPTSYWISVAHMGLAEDTWEAGRLPFFVSNPESVQHMTWQPRRLPLPA